MARVLIARFGDVEHWLKKAGRTPVKKFYPPMCRPKSPGYPFEGDVEEGRTRKQRPAPRAKERSLHKDIGKALAEIFE